MREELEKIQLENNINIDLLNILEEHFESGYKDNEKWDYYSKTRLWSEYTSLLYQIIKNANIIDKKLNKIVSELYHSKEEDKNVITSK
ncbi:MAG: hypothetical protein IJL74_00655 [Bacilli bacterium]|nr:hypothetical protein [Bacilli bacterium]